MNSALCLPAPVPQINRQATPVARVAVSTATPADREVIYRLRHAVYAAELGQHHENRAGRLSDALDQHNAYLVAKCDGEVAGFVALTPPTAPGFSIDKYFARAELPFVIDERTYEVRLLTVIKPRRGSELAVLLMYAALRWVEARGGQRIVGIGRQQVMALYQRSGLNGTGRTAVSGSVTYELMHAGVEELRVRCGSFAGLLTRLEERTDWQLPFSFRQPAACFHGGAFFAAIGERFEDLARRDTVINADVLDAWFPPAPGVLTALNRHLPWLLRTSPPTDCGGLIDALAGARGVTSLNILPGAGSSDLIFRALRHWLTPRSHALILDPTYGEYAHVLERVIGCTVDRFPLDPDDGFTVNLDRLQLALKDHYDLVVLVNPNSPTGRHVDREQLEAVLRSAPARTRVWVDETYVEYAGPGQSLEPFAAQSENVIVCKSMSKVYALSGARVAYLCAGAHQLESLRAITPPWVVGLPSQVAAVRALAEPEYYAGRYRETTLLREQLAAELRALELNVLPGIANFLLCRLPEDAPTAAAVVRECRERGLFIRDAALMGARLGDRYVRLAVKDAGTNGQILEILRAVLGAWREGRSVLTSAVQSHAKDAKSAKETDGHGLSSSPVR
jgi:histidinol-phosphate/aromatic aminotransferase/cobyric acid decarboxylase-like protein/N-acyl-L-homoserine lactone synthetase